MRIRSPAYKLYTSKEKRVRKLIGSGVKVIVVERERRWR